MYEVFCLTPIKTEHRTAADPWKYLEKQGKVKMRYGEFRLLHQFQWILRGKDNSPLSRIFRNIWFLAVLLVGRDRIVLFGSEPNRVIAFAANRLKARHRCCYVGSWPWDCEEFRYGWLGPLYRRVWRRFFEGTACASMTRPAADALTSWGARAFYIPWSVDTQLFRPADDRPRREAVNVLFVGELCEMKGIRVVLSAIRSSTWLNIRFIFVGRGRLEADIRRAAEEGHPVELRSFIRNPREMVRVMQDCAILILPSIRLRGMEEKFGMVLIEAMACGLPVIASDCVGPRQIVEHGRDGILIPQNDAVALREAVFALANDPERRMEMGRNGRRKAVEQYDVKALAAKWLEVIEATARPEAPDIAGTESCKPGGMAV